MPVLLYGNAWLFFWWLLEPKTAYHATCFMFNNILIEMFVDVSRFNRHSLQQYAHTTVHRLSTNFSKNIKRHKIDSSCLKDQFCLTNLLFCLTVQDVFFAYSAQTKRHFCYGVHKDLRGHINWLFSLESTILVWKKYLYG